MDETSMIERVARALDPECFEEYYLKLYGPRIASDNQRKALGLARDAIEAMRGLPDDIAAIVAYGNYTEHSYGGDDGSFDYFSADNAKQVWDDLIDAALSQAIGNKESGDE